MSGINVHCYLASVEAIAYPENGLPICRFRKRTTEGRGRNKTRGRIAIGFIVAIVNVVEYRSRSLFLRYFYRRSPATVSRGKVAEEERRQCFGALKKEKNTIMYMRVCSIARTNRAAL